MQSGLPAPHFDLLASAPEHIISIYWESLRIEREREREHEIEREEKEKKRENVYMYEKKKKKKAKRERRRKVDVTLARDRKSRAREKRKRREKERRGRTGTVVYLEGRGLEQLQTLSCVVPSWGKAPGYDSFRWSVKRLRKLRGGTRGRESQERIK